MTFTFPPAFNVERRNSRIFSCDNIIVNSPRALISGTGGSGKTMLMRHLFLSAIKDGNQTPVLVELRNINNTKLNIFDLITNSLNDMGLDLGEPFVKKAISLGHFIVLLDGFDEVASSQRKSLATEIKNLATNNLECPIVVSTRPDDYFFEWTDFSIFKICPLTIDESCDLINKIPYDDRIKENFIRALKDKLYDTHHSFSSNPLLLSMMLVTFGENAEIPNKESIFYQLAYEVFFQRHDAFKDGYKREILCKLDVQDFARVFSAFSILTYDKRQLGLPKGDILNFIDAAKKLTSISVDSEHFLADAQQAVCLLMQDGLLITYTHRHFQDYFTAKYILSTDTKRKKKLIKKYSASISRDIVLQLLHEMNSGLIEKELLIPNLNKLFRSIGVKKKVTLKHFLNFIKTSFSGISFKRDSALPNWWMAPPTRSGPISSFFYVDLIRFTQRLYLKNNPRASSSTRIKIAAKYLQSKNEAVLTFKKLPDNHEIYQDMSELSTVLSFENLKAIFELTKNLEFKNKQELESLDKILGL